MPRLLLCRWVRTGDGRLEARWTPAAQLSTHGRAGAQRGCGAPLVRSLTSPA
jgi:hypothetical protein